MTYKIKNPFSGKEVEHETNAWKYSKDENERHIRENRLYWGLNGEHTYPRLKLFLTDVDTMVPMDVWNQEYAGTTDYGSKILNNMFIEKPFTNPKPTTLIEKLIGLQPNGEKKDNHIVLDYFAGSGTTAHAVINLNREDGGQRKYILCEMGEYFDSVTKPRIMKVIYSPDWKGGKPVSHGKGSSHAFKYLRLESYEDTLNNLVLKPNDTQTLALQQDSRFREGYMLGYMLDVESRDSLLNVAWFRKPFDCYLHITRQNESQEKKIDLVESFNYLLGLVIEQQYSPRAGFFIVKGRTLQGEKTLVIWRDLDTTTDTDLEKLMQRNDFNPRDQEFSRIYINGDHHLDNLRSDDERWKVVMIEEAFKRQMFG